LKLDVGIGERLDFQSFGESQVESFDVPDKAEPGGKGEGGKVSSKRWSCFEAEVFLLLSLLPTTVPRAPRPREETSKAKEILNSPDDLRSVCT